MRHLRCACSMPVGAVGGPHGNISEHQDAERLHIVTSVRQDVKSAVRRCLQKLYHGGRSRQNEGKRDQAATFSGVGSMMTPSL